TEASFLIVNNRLHPTPRWSRASTTEASSAEKREPTKSIADRKLNIVDTSRRKRLHYRNLTLKLARRRPEKLNGLHRNTQTIIARVGDVEINLKHQLATTRSGKARVRIIGMLAHQDRQDNTPTLIIRLVVLALHR